MDIPNDGGKICYDLYLNKNTRNLHGIPRTT
jgi:hypothetical protein